MEEENAIITASLAEEESNISNAKKSMEDAKSEMETAKKNLDSSIESIDDDVKVDISDENTQIDVKETSKSPSDTFKDNEIFQAIEKLKGEAEKFTRKMDDVSSDGAEEMNDKGTFKMIRSIIDYAKNIARVCSNPESIRNECYMIDYIMERNTFLTSQSGYNHWFNKGEVEYIIFGMPTQIENIFAAVVSIFTVRFVIDTLNYFIKAKSPEIVTRIIEAATEGAVKACDDMKDMLIVPEGEDSAPGCGLCPSFDKIKLTYSDHLRLFMLLKMGNNEQKLVNAMSNTLTNEKKGKGLDELYTRINCHAEVEVNLIILSMFNIDLPEGGNFRNGKYVIREDFVDGYQ